MATPELIEVDNVVDIINCVALYYEKDASGNVFVRKEKFSVKWGWQAYTTPQRMFKIAFLQFGSHEYVFERPPSFIRYEGRFFVDFAQ